MKITIFIALLISSIISVNAQNYKQIGSINDLKLITDSGKIGIMDYNDKIRIPLSNYTKIEYDQEFDLYKCYRENDFEIYFEDFVKLKSNYLFTKILNNDNDYDLCKIKGKKGYGYFYKKELIIPPIYDKITVEIESYFECCYNLILEKDGLKGLNLVKNKNVLEVEYSKFTRFPETRTFIVEKDGKQGLVKPVYDPTRIEHLLAPEYDKIEKAIPDDDERELYYFTKNKLKGLYNADKNKLIIPPIYSKLELLSEDFNEEILQDDYPCFLAEKNGKQGILSISYDYKDTASYREIIPVIYENINLSKYEILDTYELRKIPAKYNSNKGYFIHGDIPKNFPEFIKDIRPDEEMGDLFIKDTLNKWGLWEEYSDKYMITPEYDILKPLYIDIPGYAFEAKQNNNKGILFCEEYYPKGAITYDKNGNTQYNRDSLIWKKIFVKKYEIYDEELLILTNFENKCGLVNTREIFKFIIPQKYDEIKLYKGDYFAVKNNGKWGLISYYGEVLSPCKFNKMENIEIE